MSSAAGKGSKSYTSRPTGTASVNASRAGNRSPQQGSKSGKSTRQDSHLTQTLKDTILNDADAAKVMTDDLDNIVALQISPNVIANYQFKNYAAMRRLLEYGSDINTPDASTKNTLYGSSQSSGGDGDDSGKVKLEPIVSSDPQYRKQLRERMKREMGIGGKRPDEEQAEGEGEGEDEGGSMGTPSRVRSRGETSSPLTTAEGKRTPTKSPLGVRSPSRQKEDEKKKEDDEYESAAAPTTANTATRGGRSPLARKQQQKKQQTQQPVPAPTTAAMPGGKSPFSELFADPDRQVKRGTFSPFSSKSVPQLEHKDRKRGTDGKQGMSEADIINQMLNEEADDEDEDGDDLFIDDDENAQGSAAGAAKKKKKKKSQRIGKTLVQRTFEKETKGKTNKKQSSAAALLASSTSSSTGGSQRDQQSVQLYKSPIRQRMEDVLMGAEEEGAEEGGEEGENVQERDFKPGQTIGGEGEEGEGEGEPEAAGDDEAAMDAEVAERRKKAAASKAAKGGEGGGEGEGDARMEGTLSGTLSGTGRKRYTHPMLVTRTFEPNNERAVDGLDNEEEVEDAELQKYTHLGIASPAGSVTEFHRFMVKTKMESDQTGEKAAAERRQKDQAILKRYNEKQVNEMKYNRQIPVSGSFVMEVRKIIGGGAKAEEGGAESGQT